MSVKFRCKRSGNVVSFTTEDDIRSMRLETGYEEVVCPPDAIQQPETTDVPHFLQPPQEPKRRKRRSLAEG